MYSRYATSFAEPSTLPSPFEALPGLEGRTKYAYRTQSTCAASIAATNEMEEDGMDEEQVTFLESSATRASVEGPRSEGMPAVDDEVYEVRVCACDCTCVFRPKVRRRKA